MLLKTLKKKRKMLCFQVSVNGRRVCTAGVGEYGLINAILAWVKCRPEERIEPEHEWRTGQTDLRIGGLLHDEHLQWLVQTLSVGDEVSIKIIEADKPDDPILKRREDPAEQKNARRKFYEECKREFDGE